MAAFRSIGHMNAGSGDAAPRRENRARHGTISYRFAQDQKYETVLTTAGGGHAHEATRTSARCDSLPCGNCCMTSHSHEQTLAGPSEGTTLLDN
jgi:hypothetical protein